MSATDKARADRRSQERADRDRARPIRRLAITLVADLADRDETLTGATLITADGEAEYIPVLRGGRA